MTAYFEIQSHVLDGQYIREYPAATADSQEDTLKLHINQYTPANRPSCPDGAVTIIGAHANGFPKELYEPFWEDMCRSAERKGLPIRSIWMADVAHQGKSGVLNEDKLGNDPGWFDHARDLLYIINVLRDQMRRPIVGVGHSLGGNVLINLALMHPRLLSGLVLIDPVLDLPTGPRGKAATAALSQLSTFRRDYWPSREEAASSFRGSKFYQSWDKRVLDRLVDVGFRDIPTALYPRLDDVPNAKPVTLLTSKHQEVFTFSRPNFDGVDKNGNLVINRLTHPDLDLGVAETYPFYRPEARSTFKKLPFLRPDVLYIHGGRSDLSAPELREARMQSTGVGVGGSGGAKDGRVHQIVLEKAGHLVPMEAVVESADAAADWLAAEMQRWRQLERDFEAKWNSKTKLEKQTVSEEWKRRIGGDPKGKIGKSQL
ncbi:MAG: hypothetical protein Q9218_001000 [Villophora microphyllina]